MSSLMVNMLVRFLLVMLLSSVYVFWCLLWNLQTFHFTHNTIIYMYFSYVIARTILDVILQEMWTHCLGPCD